MAALDAVLARVDANAEGALNRLFALLSIPSVSTDAIFKAHCAKAAAWLASELSGLGFKTSVRETPGHPIVVAHAKPARRDVPHVLFYGHYDVQPTDPLELWDSDPFQPRLVEAPHGRQIVARGAADDKGQLMTFVEAIRAFQETGGLPCEISVLLEGEEETGSPSLPDFIAANRSELKADLLLVCDTGMWDYATPAVTIMLRGLVLQEVVIRAAVRDLHSGLFGGAAVNPIHVLGKIVADLHDTAGHVTLPGFYEAVTEVPKEIADQWRDLDFDEAKFLAEVGLSHPAGEKNRSVLEMVWSRPTCDVNGIVGGYIGTGSKTVLPAQASAKFSFRLVGKQNPDAIVESFHSFVLQRLPPDCRAEFIPHGASAALQLPIASEALTRARRALHQEWDKEPVLVGCGGSIPIVGMFKRNLGIDALMIGFGLEDDRIHSPNEKYELTSFRKGARSWTRVLNALAV